MRAPALACGASGCLPTGYPRIRDGKGQMSHAIGDGRQRFPLKRQPFLVLSPAFITWIAAGGDHFVGGLAPIARVFERHPTVNAEREHLLAWLALLLRSVMTVGRIALACVRSQPSSESRGQLRTPN